MNNIKCLPTAQTLDEIFKEYASLMPESIKETKPIVLSTLKSGASYAIFVIQNKLEAGMPSGDAILSVAIELAKMPSYLEDNKPTQ